jgi:HSP20 family protein
MAEVMRWDPFREAVSLREAMDRLFEDSFTPARRQQNGNSGGERVMRLPLDAFVTSEEIVILANVPGIKPEEVEITIEGDTLTIRGERQRPLENVDYVMQERPFGKFQRTLNINIPVDANRAEARYENGLLTLIIPKAEAAKPKVIQVGTKQAQPQE